MLTNFTMKMFHLFFVIVICSVNEQKGKFKIENNRFTNQKNIKTCRKSTINQIKKPHDRKKKNNIFGQINQIKPRITKNKLIIQKKMVKNKPKINSNIISTLNGSNDLFLLQSNQEITEVRHKKDIKPICESTFNGKNTFASNYNDQVEKQGCKFSELNSKISYKLKTSKNIKTNNRKKIVSSKRPLKNEKNKNSCKVSKYQTNGLFNNTPIDIQKTSKDKTLLDAESLTNATNSNSSLQIIKETNVIDENNITKEIISCSKKTEHFKSNDSYGVEFKSDQMSRNRMIFINFNKYSELEKSLKNIKIFDPSYISDPDVELKNYDANLAMEKPEDSVFNADCREKNLMLEKLGTIAQKKHEHRSKNTNMSYNLIESNIGEELFDFNTYLNIYKQFPTKTYKNNSTDTSKLIESISNENFDTFDQDSIPDLDDLMQLDLCTELLLDTKMLERLEKDKISKETTNLARRRYFENNTTEYIELHENLHASSNFRLDNTVSQETNNLRSIDKHFNDPSLECKEKILSMKAYIDKIAFLKHIIIIKSSRDADQKVCTPFRFFYVSKSFLTHENMFLTCRKSDENTFTSLADSFNEFHNKKNKTSSLVKHFFVYYEDIEDEWFFPHMSCDKYFFYEIYFDATNYICPYNMISAGAITALNYFLINKILLQTAYISENKNDVQLQKEISKIPINPTCLLDITHSYQYDNFIPNNFGVVSNDKKLIKKSNVCSKFDVVNKILNIENTVFFIFEQEKKYYVYFDIPTDQTVISAEYLFNFYQKILNICIPKERYMIKNKFLTMMDNYVELYRCLLIHKSQVKLTESFKKLHIKYWKNFLHNYCVENKIFKFLMNGIEKHICENNFDNDDEIYSNIIKTIANENSQTINFNYIFNLLTMYLFLQNEEKFFQCLFDDISKSKLYLYQNQNLFLLHFIKAFGVFFLPSIRDKFNNWLDFETITYVRNAQMTKFTDDDTVMSNFGFKLNNIIHHNTKYYFVLNVCSMRICIIPEKYEFSLCFIDCIIIVTNRLFYNIHRKHIFNVDLKILNIENFLHFIRNDMITNLLNFCICEKFHTTIDKIISYIKYFGDSKRIKYNGIGEQIMSDFVKYIFTDFDLKTEFLTLADIIISIQSERFLFCSQNDKNYKNKNDSK
ncbi:hypothetical protein EDEG_01850 [Edhazardia aedis USNM 41457]|uniref:Uncharacterized protein n=1 Tax=Edhazardia aedis (strain USNM 41457) TaxID=1003232 RepID=J9D7S5_EDHAE|nr:hypothetical protein EDEG_01850 [Edhazardia aedis USNM 41457]|eukprot:EJW03851.1 hypothetical protein EDEG_01850 [Edhazardia aedis USNM 41457]